MLQNDLIVRIHKECEEKTFSICFYVAIRRLGSRQKELEILISEKKCDIISITQISWFQFAWLELVKMDCVNHAIKSDHRVGINPQPPWEMHGKKYGVAGDFCTLETPGSHWESILIWRKL